MSKRHAKALAQAKEMEAALARECPRCHTEPGVWCGPVLETFNPYTANTVIPWMHEARYLDKPGGSVIGSVNHS